MVAPVQPNKEGAARASGATDQLPNILMTDEHTIGNRLERLFRADPDVVRHAAKVSVWGRWFVWVSAVGLLVYRPGLWHPHDIGYVFLNAALAISNGAVHYRLLTNRPVTWRWLLFLSAVDLALITGSVSVSGRFDNYIFIVVGNQQKWDTLRPERSAV